LKRCRECGHFVALSARTCPNCGATNPAVGKTVYSISVLVSAIVAIGIAVWIWKGFTPEHTTPQTSEEEPATTFPTNLPTVVPDDMEHALPKFDLPNEVDQITNDYNSNELGADEKYKGNVIEVNGQVGRVGRDEDQRLYVENWSPQPDLPMTYRVIFFFSSDQVSKLSQLRSMQSFWARCICAGKSAAGNIALTNCVIIDRPTDWRGKCDAEGNCWGR